MQKLSDSELSIMLEIWKAEKPVYLEEILEGLEEFDWAESTVRNFLTRIIDKGYLKVEKDGRKNIYIPLVSKDYMNKEVEEIIESFYEDSIAKLIEELYKSKSIDLRDLKELQKYLKEEIDGKFREEENDKKEVEEAKERVVLKRLDNIL